MSTLLATGCFLDKRDDATAAFAAQLKHIPMKKGNAPPSTNLSRSSGEVTFLRLKRLFPTSIQGTTPLLKADEFMILTSVGLNRAIAEESRSSSSLAQIALRKWAAPLCSDHLVTATGTGSIFSTDEIWLSGETPPTADKEKLVIAAMRNGWFSTAKIDSEEAKILLAGYEAALKSSGGDEGKAKRALCMMVILAPQFWVGDVGPAAPIRRIALEIGRTTPSFADMDAYIHKKLTIDEYIRRIQTDPRYKEGYQTTVHSWHRDWWGLRPFIAQAYGYLDPRGFTALHTGISQVGTPFTDSWTKTPAGQPVIHSTSYYSYGLDFPQNCSNAKPQKFDPRVSIMAFEQRNRTNNKWEVAGTFVLNSPAAKAQLATLMAYAGGSFNFASNCTLMDANYHPAVTPPKVADTIYNSPHLTDYPVYYRCQGMASLPAGGFRATGVEDYDFNWFIVDKYPAVPRHEYYPERPVFGYEGKTVNKLYGTNLQSFDYEDRRISRYAPSGLQDGVDEVALWYTGQKVSTCNSISRYFLTCALRPEKGKAGSGYWKWFNLSGMYGWDYPMIMTNAYHSHYSMAHPVLLNQFRCGVPRTDLIPDDPKATFDDLKAYPHGFSLSSYAAASMSSFTDPINELVNNATYGKGVPEESEAVLRLHDDLNNEPYRLIDHVLDNGLRYGELFTADYTFGREELELHYRQQNYALPAYPPGYVRPDKDAPERLAFRQFKRKTFPAIPTNWFRGWVDSALYSAHFNVTSVPEKTRLPPLPTSGILTMPAFIGPVSQKMRTISSRVFTRLLCGEPGVFQPSDGAQKALHRKYMVLPENKAAQATAALHLNESKGCFSCHVGLDPLASALGSHFLANVQNDELAGMSGDFLMSTNDYYYERKWLGSRSGGDPGTGAFLGHEVTGFEGVGKVLSDSEYMTGCVFRRVFERIYGRPIQFNDVVAAKGAQTKFNEKQDFNQLIRDLVELRMYSQDD